MMCVLVCLACVCWYECAGVVCVCCDVLVCVSFVLRLALLGVSVGVLRCVGVCVRVLACVCLACVCLVCVGVGVYLG